MATPTLVPISEYLSRTYQPDREYVDGVVVERNLGERDHSRVQALLAAYFIGNEDDWQVVALVEQRVQVSSTRFRIPDVCLLAADDPDDPIVHKAPLVCIEILSREDRLATLEEKIDEYFDMGVRNVWVIDPQKRTAYTYSPAGKQEPSDAVLRVPQSEISVPLAEIFEKLPRR